MASRRLQVHRLTAAPLVMLASILLVACSTTAPAPTSSPTQTAASPSPSPSPPALTPSPSPTGSPSPSSTDTPDVDFWGTLLSFLGLPATAPVEADASGDGRSPDGSEPRDISPDLDLLRGFAGVGEVPAGIFEEGECELPAVSMVCPPFAPAIEGPVIVVGIQTHDDITIGQFRYGQLAVAFDREGVENAPAAAGGFGGADWVVIVYLDVRTTFQTTWSAADGTYQPAADAEPTMTGARGLIAGDLALIVIPAPAGVELSSLRYRIVSFERNLADDLTAVRIDTLPGLDEADTMRDVFSGP